MGFLVACFCGTLHVGVVCPRCGRCALPRGRYGPDTPECITPLGWGEWAPVFG